MKINGFGMFQPPRSELFQHNRFLNSEDEEESVEKYNYLTSFDLNQGKIKIYSDISPMLVRDMSDFIDAFLNHSGGAGKVSFDGNITFKNLFIEIMSPGGCARSGLAIYDMLTQRIPDTIKIITIGNGYVASAATFLYCAGDIRIASPSTDFLLHPPRTLISAFLKEEEAHSHSEVLFRIKSRIKQIYDENFGINQEARDVIEKSMEEEVYLTGLEAYRIGLATLIQGLGKVEMPEGEESGDIFLKTRKGSLHIKPCVMDDLPPTSVEVDILRSQSSRLEELFASLQTGMITPEQYISLSGQIINGPNN